MTRRKPRGLDPDEQALWARVTETAKPLASEFKPKTVTLEPKSKENQRPKKKPPVAPFEIGSAARTSTRAHDLSPTLTEALSTQKRVMDKNAHKKMLRGKLHPEGRLDLHGLTVDRAHGALTSFILSAQASGKRLVLVITGKGREVRDNSPIPTRTGILRHQVPHWLSLPPLSGVVLQVSEAHRTHGGSGAFYVYLRRL